MSSSSSPKKPWCKVCKDSGEPESVYSTHFVKDNKGKPICPKLLALNCRSCGESGHTVKFCKKTTKTTTEKKAPFSQVSSPKKVPLTPTNMYDALFSEDDDEETVEDFPSLTPTRKEDPRPQRINKKTSYAAVTSKQLFSWADAVSSSEGEEDEEEN